MHYRLGWDLSIVDHRDGGIVIPKLMCVLIRLLACACINDVPIWLMREYFISEIIV